MNDQKFNRMIAFFIAVVTVFAAVIAQLETVAGDNDDRAGRDARAASVEAFGLQVQGDSRSNYHYYTSYEQYRELETLRDTAEKRGDQKAADRFEVMRDNLLDISPLLSGKDPEGKAYFDPTTDSEPDVARFEANTYVGEVHRLDQVFKAASVVKNAWDSKANTYIVHITLLAVALFLFGLAGTIATRATRGIFTIGGLFITGIAVLWAFKTWSEPVYDLRAQGKAIEHYARGMALMHMDRPEDAVKEFDAAISDAPLFAEAHLDRGRALQQQEKDNLTAALESLQKARSLDPGNSMVWLEIGWVQYQLGQFQGAIESSQAGLAAGPDNLDCRFLLGISLLASGKKAEAIAEFDKGLQQAAATVAEMSRAAGEVRAPEEIIATLEEASIELDGLSMVIQSKNGNPPADKIMGGEETARAAEELSSKLVSWELALQNTGKPPEGELTAKLSELEFAAIVEGKTVEPFEDNRFRGPVSQMEMGCTYSGMKDGQVVTTRFFLDSAELDSWRWTETWKEGAEGTMEDVCYPGYSDNFVFAPGEYVVEVFVDYKLATTGEFVIEEP